MVEERGGGAELGGGDEAAHGGGDGGGGGGGGGLGFSTAAEELVVFGGGEDLTVGAILEAPGEVVGKSSYGTLYRAGLQGTATGSVVLLRFVRPACVGRTGEIMPTVRMLGSVRHPNLVPLRALYAGPRGEKLFVHPFYAAGDLARFFRGEPRPNNFLFFLISPLFSPFLVHCWLKVEIFVLFV